MPFLDYVNAALDLAKKAQSVELERQILAMQSEMNEMQRRNIELTKRISELEQQQDLRSRRAYREPSYYVSNETGATYDGPFCQPCWDSSGRVVRTHDFEDSMGVKRVCYVCNASIPIGPQETRDTYRTSRR